MSLVLSLCSYVFMFCLFRMLFISLFMYRLLYVFLYVAIPFVRYFFRSYSPLCIFFSSTMYFFQVVMSLVLSICMSFVLPGCIYGVICCCFGIHFFRSLFIYVVRSVVRSFFLDVCRYFVI